LLCGNYAYDIDESFLMICRDSVLLFLAFLINN